MKPVIRVLTPEDAEPRAVCVDGGSFDEHYMVVGL